MGMQQVSGLGTLTGLVFIVLKLCGAIAWSWWWVLSPFWGLFVLGVVISSLLTMAGKSQQEIMDIMLK